MSIQALEQKSRKTTGFTCSAGVTLLLLLSSAANGFVVPRQQVKHPQPTVSNNSFRNDLVYTSSSHTQLSAAISLPTVSFFTPASVSMLLLALQFAWQPIFTRKYAPKSMNKSTYVVAQDLLRLILSLSLLYTGTQFKSATYGWNWQTALRTSGLPAALYAIQNYCSLLAYQNLLPLTYNVLNQTKTLSAALCCYILLGQTQTLIQIGALLLLLLSALVMERVVPLPSFIASKKKTSSSTINTGNDNIDSDRTHWVSGVLPLAMASFLSGLAGALVQKSLQQESRNSLLLTAELASFSGILTTVVLVYNRTFNNKKNSSNTNTPLFTGWTAQTLIPVTLQALGGILVGYVTKHAGSVRKGFALILGMFGSGLLQDVVFKNSKDNKGDNDSKKRVTSNEQIVGGILASLSLFLYNKYK